MHDLIYSCANYCRWESQLHPFYSGGSDAQRSWVTFPQSHGWKVAEMNLNPRLSDFWSLGFCPWFCLRGHHAGAGLGGWRARPRGHERGKASLPPLQTLSAPGPRLTHTAARDQSPLWDVFAASSKQTGVSMELRETLGGRGIWKPTGLSSASDWSASSLVSCSQGGRVEGWVDSSPGASRLSSGLPSWYLDTTQFISLPSWRKLPFQSTSP